MAEAERHQINSFEFDQWLSEVEDYDYQTYLNNTRETLYDLWVEGYSVWEVPGILG